ncbi:hypothetical protein [Nocardia araoensis]|uniref:hypothetical protein n=1 Tax=Nocardia araoensis TaxID=228600 RepID=UPI0002D31BD3|nr:hypothetical protein [Nocardia araoensis]
MTTASLGWDTQRRNAIGLAGFTALADLGTGNRTGAVLRSATANGERFVVLLTAAGMLLGMLITLTLRRAATSTAVIDQRLVSVDH